MSAAERIVVGIRDAFDHAARSERIAAAPGLLQRIDPRAKLGGIGALLVAAAAARSLTAVAGLFAFALVLAIVSLVPLHAFLARAWTHVLVIAALVALPSIVITPGRAVARLPFGASVTAEGLRVAALLVARVETVATMALLLVVTTRWNALLAALRALRVPAPFVMVLAMTHRQLFVLLQSAADTFLAARSRRVGTLRHPDARRLVATATGALLDRAIARSGEVHLAMRARGWAGDARLLEPLRLRATDWGALAILAAAAASAVWIGGAP